MITMTSGSCLPDTLMMMMMMTRCIDDEEDEDEDPFWCWSVKSATKVSEHASKAKLLPYQFAIGAPNGAERMGKATAFDAAQLDSFLWLSPDIFNAFMEHDREEAIEDQCRLHPLAGTMMIALYKVPTVYVHDTRELPCSTDIQPCVELFKAVALL